MASRPTSESSYEQDETGESGVKLIAEPRNRSLMNIFSAIREWLSFNAQVESLETRITELNSKLDQADLKLSSVAAKGDRVELRLGEIVKSCKEVERGIADVMLFKEDLFKLNATVSDYRQEVEGLNDLLFKLTTAVHELQN